MKQCLMLLSIVLVFGTVTWGYNISSVTVSPLNPTTSTPVTVTVRGTAPAANFHLDHTNLWRLGNMFFLDMYWKTVENGGISLTTYVHQEPLGTLDAGNYTVYARSFLGDQTKDRKSVSFTVSAPASIATINRILWPGTLLHPLFWPILGGSGSFAQVRTIVIGGGSATIDFQVTTTTGNTE